jgi:Bacterial archaeo-eukaryotic release factor family 3
MELLTRTDLETLAGLKHPGTHLSLFMPTHRFGNEVEADPLRWKHLVKGVASVLADRGMRKPDIDELLAPAWELHEDSFAWQYMSDGLAVFVRPGWHRVFRVPVEVPEVATVGDRFVVGPLLRVISSVDHFLVLAVSQRKVRLLEGTQHRLEEVELHHVPTSLRHVIEAPEPRSEPRSEAMARPLGGGKSGPAVFYVYGAADGQFKKDQVHKFLQQVEGGLRGYLTDQDLPMVLVGLDQMLGIYRGVNTYSHVMEDAVRHNPDELSAEDLHGAAWPIVAQRLAQVKRRAIERFEQLHVTGRAPSVLREVEAAAVQGKVEALFLATDPWCWEQLAAGGPTVVELGADDAVAQCEQLDRALVGTLLGRGQVYPVSEPAVPGGGKVAAILRRAPHR